jgi:hypothetical protein
MAVESGLRKRVNINMQLRRPDPLFPHFIFYLTLTVGVPLVLFVFELVLDDAVSF